MKKACFIFAIILSLTLASCGSTSDLPIDTDGESGLVSKDAVVSQTEPDPEPQTTPTEADAVVGTGSEEPVEITFLTRQEKLDIVNAYGGVYDPIYRRYVDEVYDIYPIGKIVGDEELDEWVQNVYLAQTAEAMDSQLALYQAVKYFDLKKEALYAYNSTIDDDYSAMRIPEFVIEALYFDEADMKRQVAGVASLYYNGEVYSFDEVSRGATGVPDDIIRDYAAEIEPILRDYFTESEYKKEYSKTIEALKTKGA